MQSKHYSYRCVICDSRPRHLRYRIVCPVCLQHCQEFRAGFVRLSQSWTPGLYHCNLWDHMVWIFLRRIDAGSSNFPALAQVDMDAFMSGVPRSSQTLRHWSPGRCWATRLFDGESDLRTLNSDCIIMIMWRASGKAYEDKCCLQEGKSTQKSYNSKRWKIHAGSMCCSCLSEARFGSTRFCWCDVIFGVIVL